MAATHGLFASLRSTRFGSSTTWPLIRPSCRPFRPPRSPMSLSSSAAPQPAFITTIARDLPRPPVSARSFSFLSSFGWSDAFRPSYCGPSCPSNFESSGRCVPLPLPCCLEPAEGGAAATVAVSPKRQMPAVSAPARYLRQLVTCSALNELKNALNPKPLCRARCALNRYPFRELPCRSDGTRFTSATSTEQARGH